MMRRPPSSTLSSSSAASDVYKRQGYTPSYATLDDMTYAASDTTVASVSTDGTVTAKKSGTAVITASSQKAGISRTMEVEVREQGNTLGGTVTDHNTQYTHCLLYTSPSPRDGLLSRMPSSAWKKKKKNNTLKKKKTKKKQITENVYNAYFKCKDHI